LQMRVATPDLLTGLFAAFELRSDLANFPV
jgi:hypothetical protein